MAFLHFTVFLIVFKLRTRLLFRSEFFWNSSKKSNSSLKSSNMLNCWLFAFGISIFSKAIWFFLPEFLKNSWSRQLQLKASRHIFAISVHILLIHITGPSEPRSCKNCWQKMDFANVNSPIANFSTTIISVLNCLI